MLRKRVNILASALTAISLAGAGVAHAQISGYYNRWPNMYGVNGYMAYYYQGVNRNWWKPNSPLMATRVAPTNASAMSNTQIGSSGAIGGSIVNPTIGATTTTTTSGRTPYPSSQVEPFFLNSTNGAVIAPSSATMNANMSARTPYPFNQPEMWFAAQSGMNGQMNVFGRQAYPFTQPEMWFWPNSPYAPTSSLVARSLKQAYPGGILFSSGR